MTGTKYSAETVNTNHFLWVLDCQPIKPLEYAFVMVGERSARSDATMKMLVDIAEVRMSA